MKYTRIKNIASPISQLFLGTAWFAPKDEKTACSLFDRFFELGGNIIDTARFYGKGGEPGFSERIVGRWVNTCGIPRSEIHIQNKCCHPFVTRDGTFRNERPRVFPELITDDLYYSLDDMGLDYFDIYQLHRDNTDVPVGELMDRLESHRSAGLIRAYGLSNWTIPRIEEAINYCKAHGYEGPSTSNPSYSLARVDVPRWPGCIYADDAFAHWHKNVDITLLSWSAQAAGFFSGIYDNAPPADVKAAYFNDENFEKRRRAEILAEVHGVTPTNIALAYVLNQGFPICAIIGPTDISQLESCVSAVNIELAENEIEYLSLRGDTI